MAVAGLQTQIWSNKSKSLILLALFPVILLVIVYLIVFALAASSADVNDPTTASFDMFKSFIFYVLAGVVFWFLIAWAFHQNMILAMTHAEPLERKDNPRVYNIVENLCISRGIPMPKIYVIDDESLNAYASGISPKSSLITFSHGILDKLNDQELEAVAAHELTHIINYDIRLMVICIIFVGIIQTISEFFLRVRIGESRGSRKNSSAGVILLIKLVVFLLGFLFTVLVQMAISRKRESLADAGSVELTKSSAGLISALEKIAQDPRIEVIENRSVAQMCIENPLSKNDPGILSKLFSTHPPIKERIETLRTIG